MVSESEVRRPEERRGQQGSLFRRILVCAIGVLAAGAAIWWWRTQMSPLNRGNVALKQAYQSSRPLEERISSLGYAPLVQLRGSGADNIDRVAQARAEKFLLDAASDNPTPAAWHGLGRFYLAQGKLKEAEELFDKAILSAPRNARLHSDEGVRLMAKSHARSGDAESGEEAEQLTIALEHFNLALEIDTNLPEAIFNRALLYQRMLLFQQAREEWQRYLKNDETSAWARDAQSYLQRLEQYHPPASLSPAQLLQELRQAHQLGDDAQAWRILSQHRDRIGSVAVGELLDVYLAALTMANAVEADRLRETLCYVGDLESRIAEDHFTRDLATFYRRITPVKRAELFQARGWLKTGLERLGQTRVEEAGDFFTRAMHVFRRIGDECEALQAEYLLADCYLKPVELRMRSAFHERLEQATSHSRYKWLLTQTLIARSTLQDRLANHSEVIERSRRGGEIAQSGKDANSFARFLLQAAESYYKLGDYHKSLKLYRQGLILVNGQLVEPGLRWAFYLSIAFPLNSLKRHAAAAEYLHESLRIAQEINRPPAICRSLVYLGATYGLQNRSEEAIRQTRLAFDLAQNLPGKSNRIELLALASLKLGELRRQGGEFAEAAKDFDQAIRLYDEINSQALKYSAHKGKLLVSLAQGESSFLEEEIKTVLNLFEEYRVKIREESNRNSFFNAEQSVYDIAIDFWHEHKKDPQTAFELAERCRARSLLDLVSGAPRTIQDAVDPDLKPERISPPLSLREIQDRMPEQTQIVQYAVLKDRLLLWVLSGRQQLMSQEVNISAGELTTLVSAYLELVSKAPSGNQGKTTEAARRLYGLLIQPIVPLLDRRKQLCLVPDKMLNQLPFAALLSESGHYLIEDYSIVFAPSATMFVVCSVAAAAKENVRAEKVLGVGDPAFERSAYPNLRYLPSARREVETIATYYPGAATITGPRALKQRLEDEIERFHVLHLALHCVVDERSPMRSKLLLARPEKTNGEVREADGVLHAYEIYQLSLSRLRLVVLAACRSGVERYYGGEGMVGISRPFLAKGVPLVVASLWEVDSSATTELMIRFHQYRGLRNLPTSEALRQAQLELLHGLEPVYRQPYYWAAFESIGGLTKF